MFRLMVLMQVHSLPNTLLLGLWYQNALTQLPLLLLGQSLPPPRKLTQGR